jgi:hypothetical protein
MIASRALATLGPWQGVARDGPLIYNAVLWCTSPTGRPALHYDKRAPATGNFHRLIGVIEYRLVSWTQK